MSTCCSPYGAVASTHFDEKIARRELTRVVCCYPFYQPLLEEALRHAERYFVNSYPRDVWYVRLAIAFENAIRRIRADSFRAFVHPVERMKQVIQSADFKLVSRRQTRQWSVDVYVRQEVVD